MKDRNILTLWFCLLLIAIAATSVLLKNNCYVGQLDGVHLNSNNITILDRINPNTATWTSLARLPGIGRVRAQAIVEYREQYSDNSDGSIPLAFKNADDLQNIKGIGPKTAEQLSEHLIFTEP